MCVWLQGCMKPITVRIPKGCLLSPSAEAAVVGGNVLTSQRVTDVVLRSFTAAAASQVCSIPPEYRLNCYLGCKFCHRRGFCRCRAA